MANPVQQPKQVHWKDQEQKCTLVTWPMLQVWSFTILTATAQDRLRFGPSSRIRYKIKTLSSSGTLSLTWLMPNPRGSNWHDPKPVQLTSNPYGQSQ
jgi:hypothetical protein